MWEGKYIGSIQKHWTSLLHPCRTETEITVLSDHCSHLKLVYLIVKTTKGLAILGELAVEK